jgi:hypothetical protein
MRYFLLCAAVVFATSFNSPLAFAQDDESELRALIDVLQKKLSHIENAGTGDSRVTQIGGTRIKARNPDELVVRIYDMSDLFSVAPSYRAQRSSDLKSFSLPLFPVTTQSAAGGFGGGLGGGGGGVFSVLDGIASIPGRGQTNSTLHQFNESAGNLAAARTSIDELIEAITSTISPEDWDEVGGPASIAQLGNALIISATADTHEQIDALLTLFRKRWGSLRTVSVQANWVWLSDTELSDVLVAAKPGDNNTPFGVVDEAAWKKLRDARKEGEESADYSAVLTCYNGQTVHTLSGGQRLIVTQMKPVVGENEQIGYEAETSLVQQGAALQVTPLTNTSGKFVVLDIHSRVLEFKEESEPKLQEKVEKLEPASPIKEIITAITPPEILVHRLSTTLRVPADKTMMIGGMSFSAGAEGRKLYLLVKVSVQELRDDLKGEVVAPEKEVEQEEPAAEETEESVEDDAEESDG